MSDGHRASGKGHLVSVLVFGALAFGALAGSMAYLGGFRVGPKRVYYADFAYAAGLETGAPIKVSGIRVGQIAALRLLTSNATPVAASSTHKMGQQAMPVVRATLYVRQDVEPFVTTQSQWSVVTTGIIGDAYLELSPAAGAPLPEYASTRGVDAPHLHEIALATETVLHHLAPLFDSTTHAEDTSAVGGGPAARLVQAIAHVLEAHEDDLDMMLHQGASAVMQIHQLAAALHAAVGKGDVLQQTLASANKIARNFERDYPELVTQTLAVLSHVNALGERVDAQLTEAQVHALVTNAAKATAHLASLAARTDAMVDDLAQGKGSLGGALRDKALYDDLRALLHDIREHPYKLLWRK